MAYQFADGFDNYGNNYTMTSGYPWDLANNAAEVTSTADFRFAPPGSLPGGCVVITGVSNILRKNLSGNLSSIIVGFGIKFPTLPASSVAELCQFWDLGTMQCSLAVNSSGALQFYNGNVASPVGAITPNGTFVANTWYGVAMQITFSATVGTAQLYINGSATPAINSTGLNLITTGNAYCNQVSIGEYSIGGLVAKYDDFYCFDTTGISLNTLLGGDARILTKVPASPGTYSNWTPTGLAANWQNTAVMPPSVSDYNANNVASTKDSYTMQSAGLTVAPYFVVARASMERDDAGPHTPSVFVRSGSTDSSGVVTPALGSSYVFYDGVFATDPNTGLAWTGPAADAAQVGVIEG